MRENCIICLEKIFRSTNSRPKKSIRTKNAVTCSHRCSRIYLRVYHNVIQMIRRKVRKEMEGK